MTDESIIAIISIAISFLFGYVIGRGIEMEENTSKNYRKTKEEQMLLYKHMKEFAESLRRENDKEIVEMGFESRSQYEQWKKNRKDELLNELGYSIHDKVPENKKNIKSMFCKNCAYWDTNSEMSKLNKDRSVCSYWSEDQSYMFTQKYDFCSNFKKKY